MIVHMIGNAHIQTAGLWTYESGRDELLSTLNSAVQRCEEYPEFKFSYGDVQGFQLVETIEPKLFKRIKKLIKKGQWSIPNGCFGATHPYLMSREMWARQVALGHTFCLNQFGKTPEFAMNFHVDSFPTSYYRNLLKAGYKGLVFFTNGDVPENMPSSIFRWMNDGGEELLCYRISPHYRTRSNELYGQIMESVETGNLALGHTLCFYGVGNHGGGPTKENIEYILNHRDSFENVELKFSTLEHFFSDALMMSDSFPVFEGPIGTSSPGHFCNRRRQQVMQRSAENRLLQAERLCDHFGNRNWVRSVEKNIDDVWTHLMRSAEPAFAKGNFSDRNQSVIDGVQHSAMQQANEWVWKISRTWANEKLEDLNYQQIVLINTSDVEFDGWIEHEPNLDFDVWGDRRLCDLDGNLIPFELLTDEACDQVLTRILFRTKIPPNAAVHYLLREFPDIMVDAGGVEAPKIETSLKILKTTLENNYWTLRVSPRSINRISACTEKNTNLLGNLGISFSLYSDEMDYDARALVKPEEVYVAGVESSGWESYQSNKMKVGMINRGKIGNSPFEWTIHLCENDPRIYCKFKIAYFENKRHLELNLHLDQVVERWIDQTAAGEETFAASGELLPFHGWTCSDGGASPFAFVSNDFFGVRHEAQRLSFMLLRSPVSESASESDLFELNEASDLGVHEFNWIMIPQFTGNSDQLRSELKQLQHPPIIFDRYDGLNRPPWQNSTPYHLQEKNEKRSVADGLMTHLPISEEASD